MSNEQESNFDKARELALSDESGARDEVVEHETPKGKARYLVRPLSLADQETAAAWATIRKPGPNGKGEVKEVSDYARGAAMAILGTFDPDSGKPMFTKADLPAFMKKRDHSLTSKLMKAAGRVNAVESVEEAAGNSEGAPAASSSTP